MRRRAVLTGGYVVLDVVVSGDSRWKAAGGTAANVASNLAYLGWAAQVAGRIGGDAAGCAVLADLGAMNVGTDHLVVDPRVATPIVLHRMTPRGHSFRYGCDLCGRGHAIHRPAGAELAEVVIAGGLADAFVFDRPSRFNLEVAKAHASEGRLVVYEPSTQASPEAHAEAVKNARIVKYSAQRGKRFVQNLPQARRDQLTIVTFGAEGAEYRLGEGLACQLPPIVVEAVDAGGAGDWMTAGLLYALGDRWNRRAVEEALDWARALAALSTTLPGARTLAVASGRDATIARVRRLRLGATVRLSFVPPRKRRRPKACLGCLLDLS